MSEVNAYEYAIIVSRSVLAKVEYLLCTLSVYIFTYQRGYYSGSSIFKGILQPQLTDEQKWIPAFFFV